MTTMMHHTFLDLSNFTVASKRSRQSNNTLGRVPKRKRISTQIQNDRFKSLADIERELDESYVCREAGLSQERLHAYNCSLAASRTTALASSSGRSHWERVTFKVVWYSIQPVNFNDGQWRYFNCRHPSKRMISKMTSHNACPLSFSDRQWRCFNSCH